MKIVEFYNKIMKTNRIESEKKNEKNGADLVDVAIATATAIEYGYPTASR